MDELTAISRARKLLQAHGVSAGRVDIEAIALAEGFHVRRAKLDPGLSGEFVERKGRKWIVVNEDDHPYRQRFTIAHEIAHHVLELRSSHGASVPSDELERYARRPLEEIFCDVFAAECLVPFKSIQADAAEFPFSAETIVMLSDRYEASKPCIASRFAQSAANQLAYVAVEQGIVRHVITSRSLRELKLWINSGVRVPRSSAVHLAIANGSEVQVVDIEASDWSHSESADDFSCHEEAVHNERFQRSLSLLTFEEVTRLARSSARAERDEDDELLTPLTGELQWKKR
jgi:Zn-dependent peptidase ImmA (M78 family)